MLRSQVPQIHRNEISEDEREFRAVSGMKQKMHDFRMTKIKENLDDVRKKNWIYVGNAFREQPFVPSKP